MTLSHWMQLWHVCLIVAMGLFAVLAVCVTVGGAWDIFHLFQKLREEQSSESDDALHSK